MSSLKRVHNADLYVDPEARPGWVTGAERTPIVGEEVYCAGGRGEIASVLGKTGDGSRLVEVKLDDPKAKPFFAAASNVLVSPEPVLQAGDAAGDSANGTAGNGTGGTPFWIG